MIRVNILGTTYKVREDKSLKHTPTDGICKTYDKEIVIRPVADMLGAEDCVTSKYARHKEVIRHEIVHAFFDEAGLTDYCSDERLVEWIAKQFPKMQEAMNKAGGLNILW